MKVTSPPRALVLFRWMKISGLKSSFLVTVENLKEKRNTTVEQISVKHLKPKRPKSRIVVGERALGIIPV